MMQCSLLHYPGSPSFLSPALPRSSLSFANNPMCRTVDAKVSLFDLTFDVGDIPTAQIEAQIQHILADSTAVSVKARKTKKLFNVGPTPPLGE
jgi:hypothetical protein